MISNLKPLSIFHQDNKLFKLCQLIKVPLIKHFIGYYYFQQRSAARAEAEGDDEDDLKAQEDQEFLETLQDSKERNSGNKYFVFYFCGSFIHRALRP